MQPSTLYNKDTGMIATPTASVTPQQTAAAQSQGFSPINSTTLSSAKPLNLPPQNNSTIKITPTVAPPNGTTVGTDGIASVNPPPQSNAATVEKTAYQKVLEKIGLANDTLATKGSVTTQLQNDNQLADKTLKATQDYNNYKAASLALSQRLEQMRTASGGLTGSRNTELAATEREGNANLANLAIIANSSQGLLSAAQQNIKDKLDAQFQPVQDQIDYLTKFAQLNQNDLSESDKFKLDQRAQQKKTDLSNITRTADDLHQNLLQNNAPQSVYSAVDKISNDYVNGKITAEQAQSNMYQAAGQYGIDKTKQLQQQKLQADIAVANAQDAAVNPDTLQGMINVYRSTGVLPTFGMGSKSPLRAQFYAALGSNNGIVTDANTNKAVRAGLTTAYKTQQNQLAANQTAIGTLDQQLGLVQKYSDQVNRSNSPLVNKYLLASKSGIFGDPDTAALNNIVKTASYEFAKILSGSAASISGVTVNSAADAESMLNSAMSKGQFTSVLNLMKQEANYRLSSQKDTLNQLEKDLGNIGSLSQDAKDVASGKIPTVQTSQTVKASNGQEYSVGQIYQDGTGAKWTVDSSGKWTKQ